MRWVVMALIMLSLPLFIALIKGGTLKRDTALIALGIMPFIAGRLQIDVALISWPLWNGTVRGIQISPIDTLAIALLVTRRKGINYLPFLAIIGLYAVPLMLSLAFASVPLATVFSIIQLLRWTVVFIAVAGELTRVNALRGLLLGFALGMTLQAVYVVQEKLSGAVQATGTMAHQNVLGMMIEFAVLPLIAANLEGEKRKLALLGVLSGLIVIAGGGSRGAMGLSLIALVALTLLSVIRRGTTHKYKIVGFGVLALLVAVPLGMATLKDRFGNSSVITDEEQRKAFERAARAMAADHPFGVGANLYVNTANLNGYAERAGVAWNQANRSAPVHNAYLLARAETGWAGEGTFLILMIVPAIAGIRLAFRNRKSAEEGVVLGASIAILAIAVHSNYEFAWHEAQPKLLFFLNLAIIAGRLRAERLDRLALRRAARTPRDGGQADGFSIPATVSGDLVPSR
jgi:hypothetical protein